MADPTINIPRVTFASLPQSIRDLMDQVAQQIYSAGFMAGFAKGEAKGSADTVARILQAAQPAANGHDASAEAEDDDAQESQTSRDLVDAVLRQVGSRGATPSEIFESPLNSNGMISHQAIGKILRRSNERYANLGGGRYVFSRTRS
jgi:hypothetical protein